MSPTLPNVLVVGDNTSLGYLHTVRELLEPVAKVHHAGVFDVPGGVPLDECGTSFGALTCMDEWLGHDMEFKVIVFNWGLVDLRVGNNSVSQHDYPHNVREMYLKMLTHQASYHGTVVWLNTLPVSPFNRGHITNAEIERANRLVDTMWDRSHSAPEREDLNKVVTHSCRLNHIQKAFPADVECGSIMEPGTSMLNPKGNQFVGMHVAEIIRKHL